MRRRGGAAGVEALAADSDGRDRLRSDSGAETDKTVDTDPNNDSDPDEATLTARAKLLAQVPHDWPTPEFSVAGWIAGAIGTFALDTFFSKIEVVNEENIPSEGPVILYGNHNNQFVDGMVMMRAAERPVSFITAEVSCRKPVLGQLLRALDAVPVVRPQDLAKRGTGKLEKVDLVYRRIHGSGTKFTTEAAEGSTIGNEEVGSFEVEEVESDTVLRCKPLREGAMVRPDLVATASAFKITPKVKHADMFDKVYSALAEGKCIGIFPEGGSHDRTELLPLKVGVAIMALGALSRGTPVSLVPVGINYFSGHVFRSTVFVDVGKPVQISEELVKLYENDKTRRVACSQLLEEMRTSLELVCLTAPDFETLKVIRTARRMFQGKVELTPREYINLNLRFNSAYRLWKDKPDFRRLMLDIHEYLEFARSQGLKDKQVRDLPPLGSLRTMANALGNAAITLVLIAVAAPLIAPGLLLNLPITWYSQRVIPAEMKKAAANSSVKIAARDVAASQQIMLGIKMIPVLHVLYSLLWVAFFSLTWPYYRREPGTLSASFLRHAWWFLPLCFFFLGPYYSFSFCPRLGEQIVRRYRLLPRYLLCVRSFFSASRRAPAELLRGERCKLSVRVQDLVEELIESHPEWHKERVINRAMVLKKRSKSIKAIARGDLTPKLPSRPSFENLSRLSFS